MTGVMHRLMAVEALPRGERIALRSVTPPIEKPFLKDPLWGRLINRSIVLLALDEAPVFGRSECAVLWRAYAAPIRKARDERQGLNNVCKLNQSLLRMLRAENDGLREELKRIQSALLVAAVVKR